MMQLSRAIRLRRTIRHLLAQRRSCSSSGGGPGEEVNLAEIRQQLSQIGGSGSVDLSVDDTTGMASLCLNHTDKKNALSGKYME